MSVNGIICGVPDFDELTSLVGGSMVDDKAVMPNMNKFPILLPFFLSEASSIDLHPSQGFE